MVIVTINELGGRTTVLFGGDMFVYPSAAREAAQWILDNVPDDETTCDTCGARR